MTKTERPTVQLTEPFVPETSTYSVTKRRANTQDERAEQASRVERPGIPERLLQPKQSVADRWRVERVDNRVIVSSDKGELELEIGEARDLAELILRVV